MHPPEPSDPVESARRSDGAGSADEALVGVPAAPPTLPRRTAFLVAWASIVVAGVFGGIIGYGLADVGAATGGNGGSDAAGLIGALIGVVVAGGGVGIVAVLVLRAQAEWRRTPAAPQGTAPPAPPVGPDA